MKSFCLLGALALLAVLPLKAFPTSFSCRLTFMQLGDAPIDTLILNTYKELLDQLGQSEVAQKALSEATNPFQLPSEYRESLAVLADSLKEFETLIDEKNLDKEHIQNLLEVERLERVKRAASAEGKTQEKMKFIAKGNVTLKWPQQYKSVTLSPDARWAVSVSRPNKKNRDNTEIYVQNVFSGETKLFTIKGRRFGRVKFDSKGAALFFGDTHEGIQIFPFSEGVIDLANSKKIPGKNDFLHLVPLHNLWISPNDTYAFASPMNDWISVFPLSKDSALQIPVPFPKGFTKNQRSTYTTGIDQSNTLYVGYTSFGGRSEVSRRGVLLKLGVGEADLKVEKRWIVPGVDKHEFIVSNDGKRAVSKDFVGMRIWDLENDKDFGLIDVSKVKGERGLELKGKAFSADGKYILLVVQNRETKKGEIRVVGSSNGQLVGTYDLPFAAEDFAISPTSTHLVLNDPSFSKSLIISYDNLLERL